MKATRLAAALLALPFAAAAHQPDIPADTPSAYRAECGGCHVPFLPALLAESDWRTVMAQLDKHYGDNASLDEPTRRQIEDFLARNAGARWRLLFGSGAPPRLTDTVWFQHHHYDFTAATWSHPQVRTPSNCAACHPQAEDGLFHIRDLKLPPGLVRGE